MRIFIEVDSNDTRNGAINDALDLVKYGNKYSLEYVLCGPITGDLAKKATMLSVTTINKCSRQISKAGIIRYIISVLQWLWLLFIKRPDVVHINYVSWGVSLGCAAKILKIPIVARAGGRYDPRNLTFRWVDRFAANCEAQAVGLLNSPVKNRVSIVGDLVNMDRLNVAIGPKVFAEAENSAVRLLFLGQLVKRKGIDILVKSLAAINSNFVLYLVGGDWGQPGYPQEIKNLICELGLGEKIFTYNHRDDALALIRACDIFVLPSLSEARPRSIIEAMLLGKCVVSTKVGGIPTIINSGIDGLLAEPGNVEELMILLKTAINEEEKRNQLAKNAKCSAQAMFNINQTIRKYSCLYDSLTNKGPSIDCVDGVTQ